jgi:hypothetical protein
MEHKTTGIDIAALENVDSLIAELETQFGDTQMLPTISAVGTQGCTGEKACTGSCPC